MMVCNYISYFIFPSSSFRYAEKWDSKTFCHRHCSNFVVVVVVFTHVMTKIIYTWIHVYINRLDWWLDSENLAAYKKKQKNIRFRMKKISIWSVKWRRKFNVIFLLHDLLRLDNFVFQQQMSCVWNTMLPLCRKSVRLHHSVLCCRVFCHSGKSIAKYQINE